MRGFEASFGGRSREFYRQLLEYAEGMYSGDVGGFRTAVDQPIPRKSCAITASVPDDTNLSAKSEIRMILEDRFRLFSGLYDNLLDSGCCEWDRAGASRPGTRISCMRSS